MRSTEYVALHMLNIPTSNGFNPLPTVQLYAAATPKSAAYAALLYGITLKKANSSVK